MGITMIKKILAATIFMATASVNAASISIDMKDLNSGKSVGTISVKSSEFGLVFSPNLSGLPQGINGFHVHENSSCATITKNGKTIVGGGAGGHYDPTKTGKHGHPWTTDNHLGDLPSIYINSDGDAIQPVLAPRIKLADLSGRALMIHAGGDNHSDHPKKLGGGGSRLICGVIS